ncbi:MAG: hypothetical protein IPN82_16015 [Chitinophagaceae bacterium]|nr:hypothetical protein [Chitinophagaceae bacterium]
MKNYICISYVLVCIFIRQDFLYNTTYSQKWVDAFTAYPELLKQKPPVI